MASNVNPTVRRRRLGQELRRLREDKNMTAEQVAERLLVSQSKISRLENGRRSISQRLHRHDPQPWDEGGEDPRRRNRPRGWLAFASQERL